MMYICLIKIKHFIEIISHKFLVLEVRAGRTLSHARLPITSRQFGLKKSNFTSRGISNCGGGTTSCTILENFKKNSETFSEIIELLGKTFLYMFTVIVQRGKKATAFISWDNGN